MDHLEVYRLQGELLLEQDSHGQQVSAPGQQLDKAEACLQRARDTARHQQAKALELRAALSLGRLWKRQGKPHEARQLLTEIYDGFTEGFGTADLQEAKTWLDTMI